MRPTQAFSLALVATMTITSVAAFAGDTVHLTPPLFREQARETQKVRSLSDMITTPQPVAVTKPVVGPRAVQVDVDVVATGSF